MNSKEYSFLIYLSTCLFISLHTHNKSLFIVIRRIIFAIENRKIEYAYFVANYSKLDRHVNKKYALDKKEKKIESTSAQIK